MAAVGRREQLRDRGLGELVKELSGQASLLARQEVELAKAEVAEKGKKGGVAAAMFGGAGVAGLMTLGSLTALLILVLAIAIPPWAAALTVTGVWAGVGAVLAAQGRNKLREMGKPAPEQTVQTIKEDVRWLKSRS